MIMGIGCLGFEGGGMRHDLFTGGACPARQSNT